MGLFNFLYKLTNIFSNKRKLKVFIVLAIILFILFAWSRGVFATEEATEISPQNSDALMNYQLQMQSSLCAYLRFVYQQQARGYDNSAFMDLIDRMYNFNVCVMAGNDGQNLIQFKVYTYSNRLDNNYNIFTVDGDFSLGLTSGTKYPCKLGLINPNAVIDIVVPGNGRTTPVVNTNVSSFYLPDSFYLVRSTEINKLLAEFNKFTKLETTFETSDEELQSIAAAGFSNLNNSINTQTNQMTNSINNATTSITNSVDNLNNTITDTTTEDSQVQFAQDSNQDTTSGFFTGLFNSFQIAFTDNSYKYVQFPIPFTGKVITFSNNYVLNNIKNNQKFSVLVTLAEAFWWFALGYFVIFDIYKKINSIKSGDLTNIENDNITTDLL